MIEHPFTMYELISTQLINEKVSYVSLEVFRKHSYFGCGIVPGSVISLQNANVLTVLGNTTLVC